MCNHGNYSDRLRELSFLFLCLFPCAGALIWTANQSDLCYRWVTTDSTCWIGEKSSDKRRWVPTLLFSPHWPETPTLSDSSNKYRPATVGLVCQTGFPLICSKNKNKKSSPCRCCFKLIFVQMKQSKNSSNAVKSTSVTNENCVLKHTFLFEQIWPPWPYCDFD